MAFSLSPYYAFFVRLFCTFTLPKTQTPDGIRQYTVAAVLETDIEQVPFNRTVFVSDTDFLSFAQSLRSASLMDSNVPITADSHLLILVTCSYSWEDARYVVVAIS